MSVTTVVTKLLGGGPNSNFVNRYAVTRSDGGQFTDSTGGLTSGALVLNVANGDALTGFEPGDNAVLAKDVPAGNPTTGPGWTPDASQVTVRGYTSSADEMTPITGSVVLDEASFLRDTDDATNTSCKATFYMTSACFTKLIIEVPV